MYCSNCGNLLSEDAAFCSNCGAKVAGGSNITREQPNNNISSQENSDSSQNQKKTGLFKKIVWAIQSIFSLCMVILLILAFTGKLDDFANTANGERVILVAIVAIGLIAFINWLEKKWIEKNTTISDEKKDFNAFTIINAVIIVATIVVIVMLLKSSNRYIQMVREGYPESYPNMTYGEVFDQYFTDQEWEYFESENKDKVVEFNGKYGLADNKGTICIQFTIYEATNSFEVNYMELDGEPLDIFEQAFVLGLIFEGADLGQNDYAIEEAEPDNTEYIENDVNTDDEESLEEEVVIESDYSDISLSEYNPYTADGYWAIAGRYESLGGYYEDISLSIYSSGIGEGQEEVGMMTMGSESYEVYCDFSGVWDDFEYPVLLYFYNSYGEKYYLGIYESNGEKYIDYNSEYRNDDTFIRVEMYMS